MRKLITIILMAGIMSTMPSCTDDLNQFPHVEKTARDVFSTPENYLSALAKLYASFVTAGQGRGGANPDLTSNNGFDYMRTYLNMQLAGTDEMGSTWLEGDNIRNLTFITWDAMDPWVADMYYRCFYTIALCNEFLKNSTDAHIARFSPGEQDLIRRYRAEARFLRALAYYHALDLFGHLPFVDESITGTSILPARKEDHQIFTFIESELKEVYPLLPDAQTTVYGHVSRGAAWMLLARLYLNAVSYGKQPHYAQAMEYAGRVIEEGYQLETDYASLFNADNHLRVGYGQEIIFPLVVDSRHVVTWGGTTYLVCGAVDTDYGPPAADLGVASAWSMFRVRGEIPALFDMQNDQRAMFYTRGQTQFMNLGVDNRQGGFFVTKWSNLRDDGTVASNTAVDGVDTDFPKFRLADAYLMFAEAAVRSNSNLDRALELVNQLRLTRGASPVTISDLTATVNGIPYRFFLDERARELYWEGIRRTDLVRFDAFTTGKYLWQWKGGTRNGMAVHEKFNRYPIPAAELMANPNLWNEHY